MEDINCYPFFSPHLSARLHGDWPLQVCDLLDGVDAPPDAAVHAQDLALDVGGQRQPVEQVVDAVPHLRGHGCTVRWQVSRVLGGIGTAVGLRSEKGR